MYVQRFKNGQIDIIVNVDIFSEGFDCPDIEFIQLARPTKSLVKYLQQVGRGLRPTENKAKCIILDNVGAHIEFDLPNADRDWLYEFEGDYTPRKKRSSSSAPQEREYKGRNFEEGADDLCLILDLNGGTSSEEIGYVWKEEDDALLRTLYVSRRCSISIIASVFAEDEDVVCNRLKELGIYDDVGE